MTMYRPIFDWT